MRSLYNVIVEPKGGRTVSEKAVGDGKLLLNTELQNHQYVNRVGIVKALPAIGETGLEVGDEVIVHHNIFRRFYDVRGKEKNGKAYYKDDMFFVFPEQIYAYKRNNTWNALPGYTFVKPLVEKDMFSLNHERPLIGKVKIASDNFEVGDLVGYTPGMEYEFNIEGERLYRIPINKITVAYEYQGDEEEYNPSWSQGG
jgi:hypothetical protein